MKFLPFAVLSSLALCMPLLRAESPRVELPTATLEGMAEGDIVSFKGVPYAQPPIGESRWKEPQPLAKSDRVIHADRFGNTPVQPHIWDDIIFRSEGMSEDCLYLNIWAPASTFPGGKSPVLVYFHGGGLAVGDGSEARYDGAAFAKRGIVMVTINYRLGILGFFAHPELTKESPHHASGNYGLMDQAAAVQWVHENIARFGGDPSKITIGGESAGSFSVSAQMASPLCKDLIAGAIGQSGALLGPRGQRSLAEAEAAGVAFMKSLGADSLDQLRKLPAKQLVEAKGQEQFPSVIVDGYFLKEPVQAVFEKGLQADVPLLGGWTNAESGYQAILKNAEPTVANFQTAVREAYPGNADRVLALYAPKTDAEVTKVATDLATDQFMGYCTWKWLDLHAKTSGKPVFRYFYTQPVPGTKYGAPHASDIPYSLGNLDLMKDKEWKEADHRASAIFSGYFVNFIKTGNPNGEGLPKWDWMQASIPKVMRLDANAEAIPEPGLKRFLLLESLGNKK